MVVDPVVVPQVVVAGVLVVRRVPTALVMIAVVVTEVMAGVAGTTSLQVVELPRRIGARRGAR